MLSLNSIIRWCHKHLLGWGVDQILVRCSRFNTNGQDIIPKKHPIYACQVLFDFRQRPTLWWFVQPLKDQLRIVRRWLHRPLYHRQMLLSLTKDAVDVKGDYPLDMLVQSLATYCQLPAKPAGGALHAHPELGQSSGIGRCLSWPERSLVLMLIDTCSVVADNDSAVLG